MNIKLELPREDVRTLAAALSWMAEDLIILQEAQVDYPADDEPSGPELEAEIQGVRDLCEHLHQKLEESHVKDG
jgi:hypothetical protein